jgi:hypothetical protein
MSDDRCQFCGLRTDSPCDMPSSEMCEEQQRRASMSFVEQQQEAMSKPPRIRVYSEDEVLPLHAALKELVELKKLKDIVLSPGRVHNRQALTADYLRRKPLAWKAANAVIKAFVLE